MTLHTVGTTVFRALAVKLNVDSLREPAGHLLLRYALISWCRLVAETRLNGTFDEATDQHKRSEVYTTLQMSAAMTKSDSLAWPGPLRAYR